MVRLVISVTRIVTSNSCSNFRARWNSQEAPTRGVLRVVGRRITGPGTDRVLLFRDPSLVALPRAGFHWPGHERPSLEAMLADLARGAGDRFDLFGLARRDPGCPVCGDHPTITAPIDYEQFCGVPALDPKSLEETQREVIDALRLLAQSQRRRQ